MGSNKFLVNGMKNSPHIFFQVGFIKSKVDQNVYIKHDHKFFVFLGLYVDDSILVSNNFDFFKIVKIEYSQAFEMIDNGELHYWHIRLSEPQ
jgi:hypothetical protein